MATPNVALLGDAKVLAGDEWLRLTPDRRGQLLAHLAYVGTWVSRERLSFLFWPDRPESAARRNLRKLLFKTRALAWLEGLEVERQAVRWLVHTDVQAFQEAFSGRDWETAVTLYRGPLLPELADGGGEYDTWLMLERDRLEARWREALLRQARAVEERRGPREAANLLKLLLEGDELDEAALKTYLGAALRAGERENAIRTYREFVRRLETELGLGPTTELQQMARALEEGDAEALTELFGRTVAPPHADAAAPTTSGPTRLPRAVSSFIGRGQELSELLQLLAQPDCRILTLIGHGGIGKSRLALEAAHQLAPPDPAGVTFVPLDALSSPGSLPSTIAEALDIELKETQDPLQQLIRAIAGRRLLLVLDNFEHLMAAATLTAELVNGCPNLRLLVTSRGPLNLQEEWLMPLEGLAFPAEDTSLAEARSYDAVRLFLERAKRVRPNFDLDEANLFRVLEICRLVEGSPLGLELAAVWVRALPLAAIAQEIGANLDFLAAAARNVPDRHRSLRATFEHSWKFLSPKERDVISKLSVFRGGFRKEAAKYVADASLPILAALVDRSLLRVTASGRYDRHPLIYQYTREKLAEHPEEEVATREKHAIYYAEYVSSSHELVAKGHQPDFLQRVTSEHENLLAMWDWAVGQRREDVIGKAVKSLVAYLVDHGSRQLALILLARAQAVVTEDARTRVVILNREAAAYLTLGKWQEAQACLEEARGLAKIDPLEKAITFMQLGRISDMLGNYDDAQRLWETCLRIFSKLDRKIAISEITHALGLVAHHKGEWQKAIRLQHESLALKEHLGHTSGIGIGQLFLGNVHLDLGNLDKAKLCFEASLAAYQQLDSAHGVADAVCGLAKVALRTGDAPSARQHLQRCLPSMEELGHRLGLVEALVATGDLDVLLGHAGDARHHYLAALDLAQQAASTPLLLYVASRIVLYGDLLPARRLALLRYLAGHGASSAGLKRELQTPIEALVSQLRPEEIEEADERTAALTFESVIGEVSTSLDPAE